MVGDRQGRMVSISKLLANKRRSVIVCTHHEAPLCCSLVRKRDKSTHLIKLTNKLSIINLSNTYTLSIMKFYTAVPSDSLDNVWSLDAEI